MTGWRYIMALALAIALWTGVAGCFSVEAQEETPADGAISIEANGGSQWARLTAERSHVEVRQTGGIGGRCDLLGNGALLLAKKNTRNGFYQADEFRTEGRWTSKWATPPERGVKSVKTRVKVYGQKQDMAQGWTKFKGNPLLCANGWKHATEQSLELPPDISGQPADQALIRGAGELEDKWLLFFNIGAWAVKGWGLAVADELAPLQEGDNPFSLYSHYPLYRGTGGHNAPNDWIHANGAYWAPDETKGDDSHLWSSERLEWWTNHGQIHRMDGHDPGMAYDGERYYLFNEKGDSIVLCTSERPTGPWTPQGAVLDVGGHTGDADVNFFNNRWHMFFDTNPHAHYRIGYAWTTPSEFPRGWRVTHRIYGPQNPEQGQTWDDDTPDGNNFGTGDADVALEGNTLYLTHETPIGIAWKELQTSDADEQDVRMRLQIDRNGDGTADSATEWHELAGGQNSWMPKLKAHSAEAMVRIQVKMVTNNPVESPLLTRLKVKF
mgnify:CR=1 FL=1